MPINGYSVGRDIAVDINMPQGPVRFSILTGFDRKQMTKSTESHALDGNIYFQEIPGGWDGSIEVDKADDVIDAAFAYLEGLYYAGQNVPASTITETITNPDGSISQYRYTGVMFKYDDAGSAKGDAKVSQKIGFKAGRRIKVL